MQRFKSLIIGTSALLLFSLVANAQPTDNHQLRAVPVAQPVTIDGQLAEWDRSGQIFITSDVARLGGKYSAHMAMMYDEQALYVGVDWDDPTPMLNNYDPLIDVDRRFGFHSDSLQLHFKTDMTRQIFGWHYTKENRPGVFVVDGKDWPGDNPIVYHNGTTEMGIQQAFQVKADGTGYFQEMRIPWTAISPAGRVFRAGESFESMLDLVWGPDAGKGWPDAHHMDLVELGAVHTGWFWEVQEIYGQVILSPTGSLQPAPPAYVATKEKKLAGTIPIRVQIPATAKRFTVAINDSKGQRIRNLAGDFNPETYTVAQQGETHQGNTHTVEVLWDGLDDQGNVVSPGSYAVRGLSHSGLNANYEMSFYNPGSPAWETRDGTGGWGADHSAPSRVSAAGDWVTVGWEGAEGGSGIIGVGPDGHKKWGEKQAATALASDEKFVYFMLSNSWAKKAGLARMSLENGAYRPYNWNGKDEFPLPLDSIVGGASGGEVTAMAVHGQNLVLALNGENGRGTLAVLDAATAKLQKSIQVSALLGIAFSRDGQLFVLTNGGKSVFRIDLRSGQSTPLPTPNLEQGAAITCDNNANILIADIGPDSQVKAYSPEGKLVYTAGRKGGRPIRGRFEPQAMMRMSGIAVDGKGQIWVTEHWDYPRRVSVWGRNGKLIRDYIGNSGYAGTGAYLHDQDPTLAYIGPIELKLDKAKKTWKVTQILWVPGEGEQFPILTSDFNKAQRLTSAASGKPREYLYNPQIEQVVYMPRGRGWQPVAAVAQVAHFSGKIDRDGNLLEQPSGEWAGKNPLDGVFWNDLNSDGQVQRSECTLVPNSVNMKRTMTDWGRRIGDDLSIYTQGPSGIIRSKPVRFTADGAPIYGPEGMQKLGVDEPGDYVPVTDENLLLALSFKGYPDPATGMLGLDAKTGQLRWSYPNRYPSVHGSHKAPMSAPGLLVGPLFITGTANAGAEAGQVFVLRGNLGEDFVMTSDGLYVGALFQDSRLPAASLPATEADLYGKVMGGFSLGGEPFSGWFGKQNDGKIRTLLPTARQAGTIAEVTGLESIRKFDGPTITVDAATLARAATDNAARVAAVTGTKNYVITSATTTRTIDGSLVDWRDVPVMTIERENSPNRGGAWLSYDAKNLYVAFEVQDPTPFINEGKDLTRLFKTGDAVDLQLGTNLKSHPDPDAGDVRVVFANLNGKPVAVLMKPIATNATPESQVKYHSPIGDKLFDRVEVLASAQVVVKIEASSYILEAALPWEALSIEPQAGLTLRGDVGLISSDTAGLTNVARTYWSNTDTNLVNDLPQEAWLYPNRWGELKLEQ